jgi:hypothetical protein
MPPMARLRLLTRHDASTACVTVLTHHFLWATQRVRRLGSLVRRACRCVERKRVTQTAASREPAIVSEALLRATKCVRRMVVGAPQERLLLHGRRGPTRPSIDFVAWKGGVRCRDVMPCRLWLLGWRDADPPLCSGLLVAMPRRLGRRLEKNSAGRCHRCAPECRRHRVSRGMW